MTVALGGILSSGTFITEEDSTFDVFDKRSKDYISYIKAKELVDDNFEALEKEGEVSLRQKEVIDIIYWIYEAQTDQGMFSKKALEDMHEAESIFTSRDDWKGFCQLKHFTENITCTRGVPIGEEAQQVFGDDIECSMLSSMNIFRPETYDPELVSAVTTKLDNATFVERYNKVALCLEFCKMCDDVNWDEIAEEVQFKEDLDTITKAWNGKGELVSEPEKLANLCAAMKKLPTRKALFDFFFDKEFSATNPVSKFTRSILYFGGPREGYKTDSDRESEQSSEIKKWVMDNLYDDMSKVSSKGHSKETNTFYFMTNLFFDIFLRILLLDMTAAIGSVLVVFAYLWYMTGSGFLASVGMAEILLSLPCAWFIFNGIFQIDYFGGLNALAVFIVCAIGADDIFVFLDAYKQSAHAGEKVNRDLETRFSWVWRKSGTAMAITSATTCMAFLCTCFSPLASTRSFGIFCALVILWDYILVMSLFCTAVVIYHNKFEQDGQNGKQALCTPIKFGGCCGCCCSPCNCSDLPENETTTGRVQASFHDDAVGLDQDKVTKFFSTTFNDFVCSVHGRIIILVVALAWLIPAIIWVTKLEPTKTAEQFLREDHPLQYSITILNNEFPVSGEDLGLEVHFAWGIGQTDQGGVNQLLDASFVGDPVFEKFAYSQQCQEKIKLVCDDLHENDSAERKELIKRDETGLGTVICPIDINSHLAERNPEWTEQTDGTDSITTIKQEHLTTAMTSFKESPPDSLGRADRWVDLFGFDGKDLKFVSVVVEAHALDQWSTLPEDVVREQYDAFMELAKHLDEIVGDSCGEGSVIMTDTYQKFIFMNNQNIYRRSAVTGAVIGVAIAFVVILIATRSVILSLLSTLSILCSIMSVIGTVTMIGWTLGTMESILISILAGFSVDYVVHLAHAYACSTGTRQQRTQKAFSEMGTPVMSGMLTSVLASLPLFTCQIVFFAKFGTFLCFTILWSWLFANFCFMGLIATIGPETQSAGGSSAQNTGNGAEMSEVGPDQQPK